MKKPYDEVKVSVYLLENFPWRLTEKQKFDYLCFKLNLPKGTEMEVELDHHTYEYIIKYKRNELTD